MIHEHCDGEVHSGRHYPCGRSLLKELPNPTHAVRTNGLPGKRAGVFRIRRVPKQKASGAQSVRK